MEELRSALEAAAQKLFDVDTDAELTRPEEQFGDYASNLALQLAKQLGKNPREVADSLASELKSLPLLAEPPQVAGPGFLNFKLTDEKLARAALDATELAQPLKGQEILVEFGDPNPFKEMHIGHLYSYITGDTISSLQEIQGAQARRLSYHGDVGRQVAQAIWGMQHVEVTDDASLGQAYAKGAQAYEDDEQARAQIDKINQHVYQGNDPEINRLHQKGVKISFDHFDKILNLLSISTDKRYLESQASPVGLSLVEENVGKVFTKSDGAIIYEGEKEGLHTRVFITSKGLPTYETKDLGNAILKDTDYPKASRSLIITGNEQSEYFKVMLTALAKIRPELAKKTRHLAHGFVSLSTGKMSSRTGKVYPAAKLLMDVKDAVHQQYPDSPVKKEVTLAAVKYAFLKHRLGSDIVLDIKESISLEGNSGPYLQYAHARAQSILAKAEKVTNQQVGPLEPGERSLVRKISEYPEVIAKATAELMPHHICTYLYELAQTFNSFYEANRVIGDPRQVTRLQLVDAYAKVLNHGLNTLNIAAPNKM